MSRVHALSGTQRDLSCTREIVECSTDSRDRAAKNETLDIEAGFPREPNIVKGDHCVAPT